MTETIKKYQRTDKNQAKIESLTSVLRHRINDWLEQRPTGRIVLSVELNANQGGVGEIYLEYKERGKI